MLKSGGKKLKCISCLEDVGGDCTLLSETEVICHSCTIKMVRWAIWAMKVMYPTSLGTTIKGEDSQ